MAFGINALIVLVLLMLLCVCLVAQGYESAEIGMLLIAVLVSPEACAFDHSPLDLPKIEALDLRRSAACAEANGNDEALRYAERFQSARSVRYALA